MKKDNSVAPSELIIGGKLNKKGLVDSGSSQTSSSIHYIITNVCTKVNGM